MPFGMPFVFSSQRKFKACKKCFFFVLCTKIRFPTNDDYPKLIYCTCPKWQIIDPHKRCSNYIIILRYLIGSYGLLIRCE